MALSFGPFILGGNVFGWTVARDEGFRILDAFVERGGTTIDTADVYSEWAPGAKGGDSEELIGHWLASRKSRAKVQICTKVAKWRAHRGLSPANIRSAIEGSLERLQTDYVDVYYAHEDDPAVPQADYLVAFDALVREGKIRALGASNFSPERLASALSISREKGLASFEVSQDAWNLVDRKIERELVPLLEREGVKELPYWALASGFLTGKYRPGKKTESARAGSAGKYLQRPENIELLDALDDIAAAHDVSVTAVSLAWLRAQPVVGAPIASARTTEQLDALFQGGRLALSRDDLDRLTNITSGAK